MSRKATAGQKKQAQARAQSQRAQGRRFHPLTLRVQIEGFSVVDGKNIPVEPVTFAVAAELFTPEWLTARYGEIGASLEEPRA
ncbi:hypothetical protein [Pseudoclavibacter helvolus]|uniref:hypothetical protein n=1 Tax=Pseudoclavibacter helvolus TaxID=255205 RepID=UPI003736D054